MLNVPGVLRAYNVCECLKPRSWFAVSNPVTRSTRIFSPLIRLKQNTLTKAIPPVCDRSAYHGCTVLASGRMLRRPTL